MKDRDQILLEQAYTSTRFRNIIGPPLELEIAETIDEHQQGLMNRETLEENQGMVFVFPRTVPRSSFWMKNTSIPLDIAFVNESGTIVDIQQMEPFDKKHTTCTQPHRYVVEVNQNWFNKHGIKTGKNLFAFR